jgi:tetratricopeptide (TPR) repeat protein
MKNDAPLYLQKVECPICKAINEFETIKVGAYEEEGRDSDFRPVGVKWKNPKYQKFSPILYFMATCSNCYFTREYTAKYKDWKNDTAFRNYRLKTQKQQHTAHVTQDGSVIRELGSRLDPQSYPLQTAISKLLIGIYDELLLDRPSNLDVARYFIRVAWLFRDEGSSENVEQNVFLGYVSALDDQVKSLKQLHQRFRDVQTGVKTAVANHLENTSFTTDEISEQLKTGYNQALVFLAGADERFESAVKQLTTTCQLSNDTFLTTDGDDVLSMPFAGQSSYREFLKSLKDNWEYAPTCEHTALKFSLEFYKNAYENGYEVSEGNQQIQVEYLLGEVSRRLGKHEEAKGYFNKALKSAQQFIYQHKGEGARTALARKIYEMALAQGRENLKEAQSVAAQ